MDTTLIPPPIVVSMPPRVAECAALAQSLSLEEPPAARGSRWHVFPPWLVSLVLHLNVLILLGLWVGTGDLVSRVGEVEMSWSEEPGGGLESQIDSPATDDETLLAATEIVEVSPLSPIASEKTKPEIPLAKLVASASTSQPKGESSTSGEEGPEEGPGKDGEAASTSIFGLKSEGKKFVYVFDRSASMNSGFQATTEDNRPVRFIIFDAAKQELKSSLSKLDRRQQFHLIFYNQDTRVFQGHRSLRRMLPATDKMKYQVDSFFYQLIAEGETYHMPAIELALKLKPDVIFLLTDGEAKDDPSDADINELTELNAGKTKINVIQICREPRIDSTLIRLAKDNGGQHTFLDLLQLYELMQAKEKAQQPTGKN